MMNGAPYIGDAWVHIRFAEESVRLGRYSFGEYNTQWPLVNLLIALTIMIQGISPLLASQIVPVLSGLGALPFYVMCRRMGLSRSAALFGITFLSFNPLYTYFTFSGAVMKEAASYYLVLTLLMFTTLRLRRAKETYLTGVMLGVGLVLGHHFAALIVALYFCSLLGYRAVDLLRGRGNGLKTLASISATYLLLFVLRNLVIYWSIGLWFPSFSVSDVLILAACLISIWSLGFGETKELHGVRAIVAAGTFAICVLILRGGVLAVLTPTEPITLPEYRNYAIAGAISILGLVSAMKRLEARSLAVPAAGWIMFAFAFSLTEDGLVVFTKALHYFGILLAVGGAFTAQTICRRFRTGKFMMAAIAVFLIYASSFGTLMALKGPGAYSSSEVTSMLQVVPITEGMKLHGDLRADFLWFYLTRSRSHLAGLGSIAATPRGGELLLVTATNRQVGFVLGGGYQWAGPKAILQRLERHNLLVSSSEVTVLATL